MEIVRRKSSEIVGDGVTYSVSDKGIGIFVRGDLVHIKCPVTFFEDIEEVKKEFYGWVK